MLKFLKEASLLQKINTDQVFEFATEEFHPDALGHDNNFESIIGNVPRQESDELENSFINGQDENIEISVFENNNESSSTEQPDDNIEPTQSTREQRVKTKPKRFEDYETSLPPSIDYAPPTAPDGSSTVHPLSFLFLMINSLHKAFLSDIA